MNDFDAGFDDLTPGDLLNRGWRKWSGPSDVLGAAIAEMDVNTAPVILETLHRCIAEFQFGYLPETKAEALREACAELHAKAHGWDIKPADVHLVGDVLTALDTVIGYMTKPGSPVIVPTPAYMPFLQIPGLMGRQVIQVPMVEVEGRLVVDLERLDTAFEAGGHLLLLCNPHNPSGRVHTRQELEDICHVVDRHGGRVFSDEIHSPLVYPGHVHIPYASVSGTAADHTVTATSASKGWNIPGLKCAQVIVTGDPVKSEWEPLAHHASRGASNLGVVATTVAYTSAGPWLEWVLGHLDRNRRILAEVLADRLPTARHASPEGTYLAWIDLRETGLGDQPAPRLLDVGRIDVVDGIACGDAWSGYVRVNFGTPRPVLLEILNRLISTSTFPRE